MKKYKQNMSSSKGAPTSETPTSETLHDMNQSEPPKENKQSPITGPNLERFIIFPIVHHSINALYQKEKQTFWVTEEVDFSKDRADFEARKPNEQRMLKYIFAFFAIGDTIVNENIISRFMVEVPFPESRQFYGLQMGMETIHAEVYAAQIHECIRDKAEQDRLFRAVLTMESVKKKSQWAVEYMESKTKSLNERIVAFVIVEGIFFQCAFVVIFWFKKMYPGKLFGVTFANDLISRDEGLHADHGVEIYKLLNQHFQQRLSDDQINAIFKSAMEAERDFINEFMELDDVLGMNKANMIHYVEYQCDWWLESLGHKRLYGTANPFEWMDMMALQPRTNFFERRNGEYRRGKSVNAAIQSQSYTSTAFDF